MWAWARMGYELAWPAELLRGELRALLYHPHQACTAGEVKLLLREAFHTDVPVADYIRISSDGEWDDDPGPGRSWINDLLAHLHELQEYTRPQPYWPARRAAPVEQPVRTVATASQRFADIVGHLHTDGYLACDFAQPCVDDGPTAKRGRDLNAELQQRLGVEVATPTLWPLQPEAWDTDIFYGLIEVFHDLVARPRSRWHHEFPCGLHFGNFDIDSGRRVYRALVNRIMAQTGVELRLADVGEDTGRLVHLADEGRAELVERTLASPDSSVVGRVGHAIALFRGRDATEHDKRSAIFTLHLVLEEREALLKRSCSARTRTRYFTSPTSSTSGTATTNSTPTTTRRFATGCSGGTSRPSNSPTASSLARARSMHRDRRLRAGADAAGHRSPAARRRPPS